VIEGSEAFMKKNKTKWKNVLIALLILVTTAVTLSQTLRTGMESVEKKDQDKDKVQIPTFTVSTPAFEGAIDPEVYYVGPSDVISVNIWISPPLNFILTVTPEGSLIVPTVGEVKVADMSLAQAKKKVIGEIKKKYLSGDPSVTLISPRKILVTVNGAVPTPGRITLLATDRVESAVRAFGAAVTNRNIILKRKDGTQQRVDIPRFYAAKEDKWNPFVRDGDELIVPRIDGGKNTIAIWGGIQVNGVFEFAEGDRFLDLIELGHGFTRRARRDSVLLYRYDTTGVKLKTSVINASAIVEGRDENIPLKRFDKVVVIEEYDPKENYFVIISGEVLFPGTYPIERECTKLSSIINNAGGFTRFASLQSAELLRASILPNELYLERLMSMRGSITPEDSAYYLLESELRMQHEAVNVNFEKLILQHDTTQDVVLRSGDRINISDIRKTIYVFGQVVSPGNVQFVNGKEYRYYIQKAGDFTDNARKGDVMIIKRSTRQWLAPDETTIEEGDYIWVPKEISHDFAYYINIFSQTAAVITAAVSIALLWIQVKK
jgi:protein involved in polysaccharide export with SLBB domain